MLTRGTISPVLSARHKQMLEVESGIDPETIRERGYFTAHDTEILAELGFSEWQRSTPALMVPVHGVDGNVRFHRARPDEPRTDAAKPGKRVKYEQPQGTGLALDVPPSARPHLIDTGKRLWIVEGEKKADALVSRGEVAVALLGVWAWKRNGYPLPDWDCIPMIGREVRVLFDSDSAEKVEVRHALYSLSRFLRVKVHGA